MGEASFAGSLGLVCVIITLRYVLHIQIEAVVYTSLSSREMQVEIKVWKLVNKYLKLMKLYNLTKKLIVNREDVLGLLSGSLQH